MNMWIQYAQTEKLQLLKKYKSTVDWRNAATLFLTSAHFFGIVISLRYLEVTITQRDFKNNAILEALILNNAVGA